MIDYQAELTPDAFVAYPHKGKLVLLMLVCAAFAAIGFGMWNDGKPNDRMIAVADWIFFGGGVAIFLAQLMRRSPSLIVNQSGIFDNSSALKACLLRWEEIDALYISSIGRQRFLSIRLRDAEGFLSRQSGVKAKSMRANIKLVGAPVNIAATTLSVKLEELLEIIRQKYPAVRVL